MVSTLYGEIDSDLLAQFGTIQLLALDVDGVLSDGRIYLGNNGEELKTFHTKDGYGIKAIMKLGIKVAVITGRTSTIVQNRMQALGVQHIIQGQEDKISALTKLQHELALTKQATAAMGDDMPDIGMFTLSSLSLAPMDAHPYVAQNADYITTTKGGFGAVREVCDLILQAHGQLNIQHSASV